jgi:hypothetical protein
MQTPGEAPRLATVLKYHDGIAGPDDLYSLQDVRAAYPSGVDPRDMAWMWRRLLTILGYVHQRGLVHGLVTPDHVLVEPKDHKLVLISWCGSVPMGGMPLLVPMRWREWIDPAQRMTAATDLTAAGRSMLYLLNASAEPGIVRHLQRAIAASDAWKLLADFDSLIEALWGERQFRPFVMPGRDGK